MGCYWSQTYWEQRWDAGRLDRALHGEPARLLERLSAEAASRGMVILRLETNRSLSEAKHLYERAGFVEVEPFNNEPYAHHWFQKDLRHK